MDYSDYQKPTSGDVLSQLNQLIHKQLEVEERIEELNNELNETKERWKEIAERRLPELMEEVGLSEFTTNDGLKLTLRETIRASIPKTRSTEAIAWLEEQGHGDIVKRQFTVPFARGQEEEANRLRGALADMGFKYDFKSTVHPSTLGAFVREKLREGEDLPIDLLGVFRQRATKVEVGE